MFDNADSYATRMSGTARPNARAIFQQSQVNTVWVRTKGQVSDTMPGPIQYGPGLKAFMLNLLVAQMLSLKHAALLSQAITRRRIFAVTGSKWISGLNQALQSWEATPVAHPLERLAPCRLNRLSGRWQDPMAPCRHRQGSDGEGREHHARSGGD